MNEHSYPLFVPPDDVTVKSHRDWSEKEAQSYFDWLMASAPGRIDGLLRFFDGADRAPRNRQLLLDLGDRVAQLLASDEYSQRGDGGSRVLTNVGYAIAADMGLLAAQVLQETVGSSVRWEILRKPKSDISYNLPVLTGFGKLVLDPIGGSVAEATGILSGSRGADAWVRILDFWAAKAR